MKKAHLIAGLCWFILAVAVCWEATRLKVGDLHRPGPGFLPFIAGTLLGLLSLTDLIQSWLKRKEADTPIWSGVNFRKLGAIIVALFLYLAMLNYLGFVLDTYLLLIFLFRVVEPYRWQAVLLSATLTMAAAYAFFVWLLDSRLPAGILGF